ncbi:MAG: hypothetical protein M1820_006082 [Bogoriella megaspora]|nr:MAG: hypothetical protein M1820_006082 [Bogoriella megaspora]
MASTFRQRALTCIPQQELPPRRYWVGVLYHTKRLEDVTNEFDFLWIKANGKITVQTIHDQYVKRHTVGITLKLGEDTPNRGCTLSELNHFGDNVVIFHAIERSGAAPIPAEVRFTPPHTKSEHQIASPGIPTTLSHAHPGTYASASPHRQAAPRITPVFSPLPVRSPSNKTPSYYPAHSDQERTQGSPPGNDRPIAPPPKEPNPYLGKLLDPDSGISTEILEDACAKSVELLDTLKQPLQNNVATSPDIKPWLDSVLKVRSQYNRAKTTIGVVGDTGAGKSSVINALLDEERLVPTNCMRACTAVVTEMSWNDSEDESSKYKAEIEFIKKEDWAKELNVLFQDMLDPSGRVSRESQSQLDSEAGIAYAKIRAVYPNKTKDELAAIAESENRLEKLLRDPAVQKVLGSTKSVKSSNSDAFYEDLQRYVDSKEKPSRDNKNELKRMEFWPLIKVVRIFTRSPVLATGAVIVDLPGVHDSNAARAAVCEGYMKQCVGLFIIAPIIRAVDNKAAKELLGDSFKRQLKYDGTYGNVTFVCSKTDDISISEATSSLDLDEDMAQSFKAIDTAEHEQVAVKKNLDKYRKTRDDYNGTIESLDDQIERWEDRKTMLEDGETVYATPTKNQKRKRRNAPKGSSKRSKKAKYQLDSDEEMSDNEESNTEVSESEDERQDRGDPLTEDEIDKKLEELKQMKKEARKQKKEIDDRMKEVRGKLKELKDQAFRHQSKIGAVCIAKRNEYSRTAIQQDFAAGIKELDQENAAEEDEANFNPDEDLRDYDKVARSLPVFCVSSRAYQKLCGRMKKDAAVPGFTETEQTEIPKLKQHCIKLTVARRAEGCRQFLNSLSQLLNSLHLWATNDGGTLTSVQRDNEERLLQDKFANLTKQLRDCIDRCVSDSKDALAEWIFERYGIAIDAAVQSATKTAERWGLPRNNENPAEGGYHWATYKALCRRNGVFANPAGKVDLNDQLTDPLLKALMPGWERAFQRIPRVMRDFSQSASSVLSDFHRSVEDRVLGTGAGLASIGMLAQQMQTYKATVQNIAIQTVSFMSENQKEANRQFTPAVMTALEAAYEHCVEERGLGSFKRMKGAMQAFVDQHKNMMFSEATKTVQAMLTGTCHNIRNHLYEHISHVENNLRRDYLQIVVSGVPAGVMPPRIREMRKEVGEVITGSEGTWKQIVDGSDGRTSEVQDAHASSPEPKQEEESFEQPEGRVDWENDDTMVEDDPNRDLDDDLKSTTSQQKPVGDGFSTPQEERPYTGSLAKAPTMEPSEEDSSLVA